MSARRWARLISACLFAALGAPGHAEELLQERLQAHIGFLADDALQGRMTGSAGYLAAANHVRKQFIEAGLVPAGSEGGWYQSVPIRQASLRPDSAFLVNVRRGIRSQLKYGEEFYAVPSLAREQARVRAQAVFAGYGIDAPELGYSDYEGLDVRGRVAVIFSGMPVELNSEEGAHFASYREKHRAAVRHGAVGVIRVHTPRRDRRFAWSRYSENEGLPVMTWLDENQEAFGSHAQLAVNAVVHHSAASVMFASGAHPLETLVERDEAGDPLPGFQLGIELEAGQQAHHSRLVSPNVIGMLPGADPELARECIVYVSHLDHLGERQIAGHDDRIHNGAVDNAAGVAVMLETARLFAQAPAPRRSVVFLAVTAEEQGLIGSEYFSRHPTLADHDMVFVINLDMPVLLDDLEALMAFGAERSTAGQWVRQAVSEFNIPLVPALTREENIFVRSDHYPFVQAGIPAVYLMTTTLEPDSSSAQLTTEYFKRHYHQPSDDLLLSIDFKAAERFTRINHRIGALIAEQKDKPTWHSGDFFAGHALR